jgi:hypothetical protein
MRHKIPIGNWSMELAYAIENATNGDVIEVLDEVMAEFGKRALKRMCPEKAIVFEIVESQNEPKRM